MGTDIGWNWALAGGAYSAVAGVLAAFTFGAIVLVLSNAPTSPKDTKIQAHLFHSLLIAFFSLIVSALLYAIIQGEETRIRAFFLGMGASTVFVLATFQLLTSIVWCVRYYQPDMPLIGAKFIFGAVMLIGGLDLTVTHGDFIWVINQHGTYWYDTTPQLLWWGITCLIVGPGVLGIVLRVVMRLRIRKSQETHESQGQPIDATKVQDVGPLRAFTLALIFSSLVTVALAAAFGVFADIDPQTLAHDYQPLYSFVTLFALGICILLLFISLPVEPPSSSRSSQTSETQEPVPTSSRNDQYTGN